MSPSVIYLGVSPIDAAIVLVDLLTKILKEEEEVHVDWAEIQRTQIEQMGIENYLVNQIDSPAS